MQHNVAAGAIIAIDSDLVDKASQGGKRKLTGTVATGVVIACFRTETRNGASRVDGQQRIERTANGIQCNYAVAGRGPRPPNRAATDFESVIRFARFGAGVHIRASQGDVGSSDGDTTGEGVVGGRHNDG